MTNRHAGNACSMEIRRYGSLDLSITEKAMTCCQNTMPQFLIPTQYHFCFCLWPQLANDLWYCWAHVSFISHMFHVLKNIKSLMGLGQGFQAEFGNFRYIEFQVMNAIPLYTNRLPADMDTNSRSYLKENSIRISNVC